jgi:hypothetical protein
MPTAAVASLLSGVGLANSEAIRRWNWFKATECKKLEVSMGYGTGVSPSCMPQRKSPDVLIIGAGFAGAIVARELRMAGLSSTILEARDRIGGRTFTATWLGEVIELGGHYVHWYTNTLSLTHSLSLFPPPPSLKHTHTHSHTHSHTHTRAHAPVHPGRNHIFGQR